MERTAFRLYVAAIALRDLQVLLLRRSDDETFMPGIWGVPCGKLEFGEEIHDAVLREFHEETGLSGTVKKLTGYATFMSEWRGELRHNVQLNFLITPDPGPVVLSRSHSAYKWQALNDLSSSNMDEHNLGVVKQVVHILDS